MKVLLFLILGAFAVSCTPKKINEPSVDVVLVGGGIMSGTLGVMLKELDPTLTVNVYERLNSVAQESSYAWNNAGTGHSAFCELNYTPEKEDGTIDIQKAIPINESFEVSKQFWSYQVKKGVLIADEFIHNVPHMSFVWGEDRVKYLKKRYDTLSAHPLFQGMEYSEDPKQLMDWIPLVMKGRDPAQKIAATRMAIGTDVDFGAITRGYFKHLEQDPLVRIHLGHEVKDFKRNEDGSWQVTVRNLGDKSLLSVRAKFVFIGAGGGALPLLEKSGIPEARGYGGFPVGGEWLVTNNEAIIAQHEAKVYGMASVGSPPMSVPHLDTRIIDGKKALLFGPFATFSTKYLKNGSWLDLPKALNFGNIIPMMQAGLDNIPLTKYLIGQVLLSQDERIAALREYFPEAKKEDWRLELAGQRVQVIKEDPKEGGILQFGTEVVSSADGTMVSLLGASPGASTAAPIMLGVVQKSFKEQVASQEWQKKLREIFPSYGRKLSDDIVLLNSSRKAVSQTLGLKFHESQSPAKLKIPAKAVSSR